MQFNESSSLSSRECGPHRLTEIFLSLFLPIFFPGLMDNWSTQMACSCDKTKCAFAPERDTLFRHSLLPREVHRCPIGDIGHDQGPNLLGQPTPCDRYEINSR